MEKNQQNNKFFLPEWTQKTTPNLHYLTVYQKLLKSGLNEDLSDFRFCRLKAIILKNLKTKRNQATSRLMLQSNYFETLMMFKKLTKICVFVDHALRPRDRPSDKPDNSSSLFIQKLLIGLISILKMIKFHKISPQKFR